MNDFFGLILCQKYDRENKGKNNINYFLKIKSVYRLRVFKFRKIYINLYSF